MQFEGPVYLSSCDETTEIAFADDETQIIRARKQKLNELLVGRNVVVTVPLYDRGPTDPGNIRGIIKEVSDFGYRIATEVGTLSVCLSRNQIEAVTVSAYVDTIPSFPISLCEAVWKLSKTGGQGFLYCKCKGGWQSSKCKCKKSNVLCNSRCHGSMSCSI